MKYPSFEKSMMQSRGNFDHEWALIRHSYERNFLEKRLNDKKKRVAMPKIIHQIWLGSELPVLYREFSQTWREQNPDWQYILWTDEEVQNEKLINRELYQKVSNFGAKSDILRYEILYKYGGLYVDTDFYCLKSFNILQENLYFYTGIHDHFNFALPNGLIASVPGHPILENIIYDLQGRKITDAMLSNPDELMSLVGPGKFTEFVIKYLHTHLKKDRIVVFPCTFFYPSPASVRGMGVEYLMEFNKTESFANHLWEVSWVNAKAETKPDGYLLKMKKLIPKKFRRFIRDRVLP